MEAKQLITYAKSNSITLYAGDFYLSGDSIVNGLHTLEISINEYLKSVAKSSKIKDALKMVLYSGDENLIINELSIVDRKKIELAYYLCRKDKYIVLEYFEKGLTYKEKIYFQKLFRKICQYNISILLKSNDTAFLCNIVDKICVIRNEKVIQVDNNIDWFDENLYEFMDKSEIIKFITYCQSLSINLDKYLDLNELIKAIYRVTG